MIVMSRYSGLLWLSAVMLLTFYGFAQARGSPGVHP